MMSSLMLRARNFNTTMFTSVTYYSVRTRCRFQAKRIPGKCHKAFYSEVDKTSLSSK